MTIQEYFQAGYEKRLSERPAFGSSTMGMAFTCGVWCRDNGIPAQEIKQSRGYSWIVNRTIKLNFKDDDYKPTVTRL